MCFELASYEVTVNLHSKIDKVIILLIKGSSRYSVDIDEIDTIPLSVADRVIISRLKEMIDNYNQNDLAMHNVITMFKLI